MDREMRRLLPPLGGRVLDVGCGERPYEAWMTRAEAYVGLDVYEDPNVDIVVEPGRPWPLEDGAFDTVVCLQVLEHVRDPELVLGEIERVLRPGGRAVVAVPFVYTEHGGPHDYRRFSRHGLGLELAPRFEVRELRTQGGVASSTVQFWLNFLELSFARRPALLALVLVLLPLWLALCAVLNVAAVLLDRLDRTESCYGNVVALVEKPAG